MTTPPANPIIESVYRLALAQPHPAGTDALLLERFLARRDEVAFEELVRRHGPMVLGVCRRTLLNHQDAEDAFQATFLVLALRAASVVPRGSVGPWLHGVARRSALKALSLAERRRRAEQAAGLARPLTTPSADA